MNQLLEPYASARLTRRVYGLWITDVAETLGTVFWIQMPVTQLQDVLEKLLKTKIKAEKTSFNLRPAEFQKVVILPSYRRYKTSLNTD